VDDDDDDSVAEGAVVVLGGGADEGCSIVGGPALPSSALLLAFSFVFVRRLRR
jgi:hypothetical protein